MARTVAANILVSDILKRVNEGDTSPITIAGHSHGGNVAIEALNIMARMSAFDGIEINLVTINTPVRADYQLNAEASGRVNHFNVYDENDPVQINGGDSATKAMIEATAGNSPITHALIKASKQEVGIAGRKFPGARNIKVRNPQPFLRPFSTPSFGTDIHNSHNRIEDWIDML